LAVAAVAQVMLQAVMVVVVEALMVDMPEFHQAVALLAVKVMPEVVV